MVTCLVFDNDGRSSMRARLTVVIVFVMVVGGMGMLRGQAQASVACPSVSGVGKDNNNGSSVDCGTIGGGRENGAGNYATVGGGRSNIAGEDFTTVGGGSSNYTIFSQFATIAGGQN